MTRKDDILQGKSIIITGALDHSGKRSFGALADLNLVESLFSRDELRVEFRNELGEDSRLRWFIGDVRDRPSYACIH